MNGFGDATGLLQQIELASKAAENIRRAQRALDCSSAREAIRRAQAAVNNAQLSETIRRAQQVLGCSSTREAIRRAQAAVNNAQLSETIRRAQQALGCSSMREAIRGAQAFANNAQLFESIRRAQQAFDFSSAVEGVRRMQVALDSSSLALHRVVQQMAKASAQDFNVGHTANRLVTQAAEIELTRERAQARDLLGRRLRRVGRTATNRLARLASRRKIRRPVGSSLRDIAEFVFSKKSFEQIYDPLISDLRVEYLDALASNRKWKARWVRARGYGSFLRAALAHAAGSPGDLVVRLWRIFQMGG